MPFYEHKKLGFFKNTPIAKLKTYEIYLELQFSDLKNNPKDINEWQQSISLKYKEHKSEAKKPEFREDLVSQLQLKLNSKINQQITEYSNKRAGFFQKRSYVKRKNPEPDSTLDTEIANLENLFSETEILEVAQKSAQTFFADPIFPFKYDTESDDVGADPPVVSSTSSDGRFKFNTLETSKTMPDKLLKSYEKSRRILIANLNEYDSYPLLEIKRRLTEKVIKNDEIVKVGRDYLEKPKPFLIEKMIEFICKFNSASKIVRNRKYYHTFSQGLKEKGVFFNEPQYKSAGACLDALQHVKHFSNEVIQECIAGIEHLQIYGHFNGKKVYEHYLPAFSIKHQNETSYFYAEHFCAEAVIAVLAPDEPDINNNWGGERQNAGRTPIETKYPDAIKIIRDYIEKFSAADPRRRHEMLQVGVVTPQIKRELAKHDIHMSTRTIGYLFLAPNRNMKHSTTYKGLIRAKLASRMINDIKDSATTSLNDVRYYRRQINKLFTSTNLSTDSGGMSASKTKVISDDQKAKIPVGKGTFVSKHHKINRYILDNGEECDGNLHLNDHDFCKMFLTPMVMFALDNRTRNRTLSLNLDDRPVMNSFQKVKKSEHEDVYRYKGRTFINLYQSVSSEVSIKGKNNSAAYLAGQMLDLIVRSKILETVGEDVVERLIIIADNGGDTCNQHEPNCQIWFKMWKILRKKYSKLKRMIVASFAPGDSASNPVERMMSPLSKKLAGLGDNDPERALETITKL